MARTVPWGYRIDPDDDQILIEVPEMMKLLKAAKVAWVNGTSSQQQIADWLTVKSGVPITKMGLKIRLFTTSKKIRKRQKFSTVVNE